MIALALAHYGLAYSECLITHQWLLWELETQAMH